MPTITITQQKSTTSTIRQDLKSRMAPRRRLPHPNTSASSSTAAAQPRQNTIGQQPPVAAPAQLILTYSEFLGNFDTVPLSFNEHYRDRPSFGTAPFVDTHDAFGAGPSRSHSGFYPIPIREVEPDSEYVVESGWSKDVFGRDQWVGHGRIEEVVDDEEPMVGVNGINGRKHKGKGRSTVLSSSSRAPGEAEYDLNGFHAEDIPLNSTPPPGPRPKKLASLRPTTPTGSTDYHSLKATSTAVAAAPAMPAAYHANNAHASGSGPPVIDDETEVSLVKENLDLLVSSQEDVKLMNEFFLTRSLEHELSGHIDVCSRIEESLASLRMSLTLRTQIGAEEWNVRSASWYQKYAKRLLSLRTTLRRLERMSQQLEDRSLRPRQRNAILTKLEQHEAKLADLASKYSTAFDRLRLRHLHFLLTQSHDDAKRQKAQKSAKLMSRASFERRWKEGKTLRETLRINFHDLRQEFYNSNSQRTARNPSAP